MNKAGISSLVGLALVAALAVGLVQFREAKPVSEPTRQTASVGPVSPAERVDPKAETKKLFDALRERKIETPTVADFDRLCGEGLQGACAEAGQAILIKCQDDMDEKSRTEACARAGDRLMKACARGFISSCDTIFQSIELVSLRDSARGILDAFCTAKLPEACMTFEMALRNRLDLDRLATNIDKAKWNAIRNRYISLSDENCDGGHLFSCLSVLDEDPSTADKKRIERGEERLRKICDRASEQFEKENCLWFAEYLATSQRASEGQRYADSACAVDSETGCFEAARISFSMAGGSAHGIAQLKRACEISGKMDTDAKRPDYCPALESALKSGASSWEALRLRPSGVAGDPSATFAALMKLQPRQTY